MTRLSLVLSNRTHFNRVAEKSHLLPPLSLSTGGCDFDQTLCRGTPVGDVTWHREVGLLSRRSDERINDDSGFGEAPLFDHSQPLTTKGLYNNIMSLIK